jgi:protein Tex
MDNHHVAKIATELSLNAKQVEATALLFEEEATVPFIARYRKEATDGLDEVAITAIRDRLIQLAELDKRREAILKSLEEHGHLTDELKAKVMAAETMAVLEDIYLPFRPKRRTRATVAKEKGLEPLADLIFAQEIEDLLKEAEAYVDAEKGVESVDEALAGARDIIAEAINENPEARSQMRALFEEEGAFQCKVIEGKEEEGAKFRDYFDWTEAVSASPSHRVLAMRRGEKEGILSLRINPPEERAIGLLERLFVKSEGAAADQVKLAIEDGHKRLLSLGMETEIRVETKKRADAEAIDVFKGNLRELLLAAPFGERSVMAIDPGFRTGCKLVCLDPQGTLLHNDTVYPGQGEKRDAEAAEKIRAYCEKYTIEAIAVGNGTGGRELETFIKGLGLAEKVAIVMINESGASVYSASAAAREEFPEQDLTVRGAVSIGRRMMDPLAELVKIDAKSIGVGQYQHDVDQTALKTGLDDSVMSCVNGVGVEVNTASKQILTYVSGLGPTLAQNILSYRKENGPFKTRTDLTNVPRLGPKAFEQAAGFLRIRNSENALDASAVHPESYGVVDAMAKDLGCTVADLMKDPELRKKIDINRYVTDTVGLPTLTDILAELAKPGRDPREQFEAFQFADGVEKLEDLKAGSSLPGIVTNVTAFGAFVDVGVHQDGLVHVSQLADRFIKNPAEFVKVGQKVTVKVMEVDLARKRISLSMRKDPAAARTAGAAREGGGERTSGAGRPASGSGGDRRPQGKGQGRGGPKRSGGRKQGGRPQGRQEDRGQQETPPPGTGALADALRRAGLS